jgi:7-dehydrocholesterol reductase
MGAQSPPVTRRASARGTPAAAPAAKSAETAGEAPKRTMWTTSERGVSQGLFPEWMRATVGPLLIMAITLVFAPLIVFTAASPALLGSLRALLGTLLADPVATLRGAIALPTERTWRVLGTLLVSEIALLRVVPGRA